MKKHILELEMHQTYHENFMVQQPSIRIDETILKTKFNDLQK